MAPRSLACLVMLLATTATAAPLVIAIPDQPTVAAPVALAGGSKQAGDGVVTPVVAPSGHDAAESESKSQQGLKKRENSLDDDYTVYGLPRPPFIWIDPSLEENLRAELYGEFQRHRPSGAHSSTH
ncbi:hypothetical protein PG996_002772 [Apiospora saccharicola]|uniref:Uncharacterized protein n=1 Tax=Apiospora saccharicola TaxID=335842 RepID=A0ABR1WNF5_9PEZI